VTLLSACTALGGSTPPSSSGSLQKLKVTILISTDLPPFWIAKDEGYFAAEGLDVDFDVAARGDLAIAKAINGESSIVFSTYPLLVQSKGDVQVVADGTSASPNSNLIVTVPNSPVKRIEDLKDHRVAVTSKNSTSELLTKAALIDHGVDPKTVQFFYMGLPDMGPALEGGRIDAAYQPEPFITQDSKLIGAARVIDVASPGSGTDSFPIGGYFATRKFIQGNPKTVAAFQRAMAKGVQTARSDRPKLNAAAVKYIKNLEPDVAQMMTPPNFETGVPESRRLQRVPDLMLQLGSIGAKVDITPMIAPQLGG
jgi:NitT/TauT family transport system substrate-binding protein